MADEKILVIEDDLFNMELAVDILIAKGYQVVSAENGFRALKILKDARVDLIIMDIQLPDFDGISLCREIRKSPEYRKTPIVAFTAHAMKGDEEKFLSAGFTCYAAKPIDTRQFPLLIKHCLEGDCNGSDCSQ
ncbi:MAG: response regulator [Nitrospirota bacterium]|nr:response regulator [Nitrospirota bacterium]